MLGGSLVLFTLLAYLIYGLLHSIFMLGAFVLFIVYSVILSYQTHKKLSYLAAERQHDDIGTFAKCFDTRHVDTWVIRAVYEELQAWISPPTFPIRADDDIRTTLEIDEEDLREDIVKRIAQRTGRDSDWFPSNPLNGQVHTARDLVMFFNAQPRRDEPS